MDKAEKWHGLPVPPLDFVRHGQPVFRGTAVPPILFGLPSFSVGHGQPVLSSTPPILFGPPVQTWTGPKTENENSLGQGRTEMTRLGRSGSVLTGPRSGPILDQITYAPSNDSKSHRNLALRHESKIGKISTPG